MPSICIVNSKLILSDMIKYIYDCTLFRCRLLPIRYVEPTMHCLPIWYVVPDLPDLLRVVMIIRCIITSMINISIAGG